MGFLARYGLIGAAIVAAFYSLILARASYLYEQDSAVSVPAAVRLVPFNATYVARLASWQGEERESLLHRAVALNPFDAESWVQLGLLDEMQKANPAAAERDYLRAAEVDHMFMPKWTLTNFYFRQQRPREFFSWAKAALAITPYAADPIFAQMWMMSQDLAMLQAAIPNRPGVLLGYAWFLAYTGKYAAIPEAVARLLVAAGGDDPHAWGRDDLLAASLDRMLAAGQLAPALQVWRNLAQSRWIEHRVPTGERPLTNGDFAIPFYRHGFDWVPLDSAGIRVDQFPDEPAVSITLSGDQAEHSVVLQQYVPLEPGSEYFLHWQAKAQEIEEQSGLAWHLRPVKGGAPADLVSGDLTAGPANWQFRTPASGQVFLLALEYTRPTGSIRSRGMITLQGVSLKQLR